VFAGCIELLLTGSLTLLTHNCRLALPCRVARFLEMRDATLPGWQSARGEEGLAQRAESAGLADSEEDLVPLAKTLSLPCALALWGLACVECHMEQN
jgi:hypothetical protein